jgi:hypothetical protein
MWADPLGAPLRFMQQRQGGESRALLPRDGDEPSNVVVGKVRRIGNGRGRWILERPDQSGRDSGAHAKPNLYTTRPLLTLTIAIVPHFLRFRK